MIQTPTHFKILIVEDEESLIHFLQAECELEGYEVAVQRDGQAALDYFNAHGSTMQLILLDWMLPKLDGVEVCRRIRKQSAVPIIMMTAKADVGDRVAALDMGLDDYLIKPFHIEELLARIRVIQRRQLTQGTQRELILNDLVIDRYEQTVVYRGEPVNLSAKELDLLIYFVEHNREVVDRDTLLDAVWGYSFSGQTNLVDVYVLHLRQKLSREGIETVRGSGYRGNF